MIKPQKQRKEKYPIKRIKPQPPDVLPLERCTCEEYEWEAHFCPYQEDVWDAFSECRCCPYCEQRCAEDI